MTRHLRLSLTPLVLEEQVPTHHACHERALQGALVRHLTEAAAWGALGVLPPVLAKPG
ncbi:hypothetical protein [Teichococcus wenyumeiae]|uniref:hypothetical protein n=1 Tax=Teichococcus wenyumeiae TaxID=2478470 RepID=UPI001314DDDC|nr:hypothetical protein [Pseudoroseomonas wenyumeiae]